MTRENKIRATLAAGLFALVGISVFVHHRALKEMVGLYVQTPVIGGGAAAYYDWQPYTMAANVGGTSVAPTANATTIGSITSPTSATYTKLAYSVATIDATSTDFYNLGWYDTNGKLLCSTGAITGPGMGAVGYQTLPVTPACTFQAGARYYLAMTGNATTLKWSALNGAPFILRQGSATGGSTTNGVFNASITPPPDSATYVSVNPMPWVAMRN